MKSLLEIIKPKHSGISFIWDLITDIINDSFNIYVKVRRRNKMIVPGQTVLFE
jgi:hypothetical protein